MRNIARISSAIFFSVFLSACGGGSDSDPVITNPPPPITEETPTWVMGQFEDAANFKSSCANPRSGSDINGNAFTDVQGTLEDEKLWIRSWVNDTYLWYDEVIDRDPANYADAEAYFTVLKTNEITASGKQKDEFSFSTNTEAYQQQITSGSSAGYGMRVALIRTAPPRQALIAFTEPDSPASNANITRGAEILEIDGADLINGNDVDTLNGGLFPGVGEEHTFVIRDLGATDTRTVTLTSAVVTSAPVQNTKIIQTDSGNVAYMTFNTFGTKIAQKALYDAFSGLENENISDLVLDLRYNGGGFLAIAAQLGHMIAGSTNTSGKTFELSRWNDKYQTVDPFDRPITPVPFIDITLGGFFAVDGLEADLPLPSLNLNRVFILSTGGTCSASESVINGLRGADVEVILVGDTTCGKPYGFIGIDNCDVTYFPVQIQSVNNKGFGEFADGFVPSATSVPESSTVKGCVVADDFGNLLGDPNEELFKTVLDYRNNGNACPVITSYLKTSDPNEYKLYDPSLDLLNDPRVRERLFLEQNRINNLDIELNR